MGKKINLAKSQGFFSEYVNDELVVDLGLALGVNVTKDLGLYLGTPMLH